MGIHWRSEVFAPPLAAEVTDFEKHFFSTWKGWGSLRLPTPPPPLLAIFSSSLLVYSVSPQNLHCGKESHNLFTFDFSVLFSLWSCHWDQNKQVFWKESIDQMDDVRSGGKEAPHVRPAWCRNQCWEDCLDCGCQQGDSVQCGLKRKPGSGGHNKPLRWVPDGCGSRDWGRSNHWDKEAWEGPWGEQEHCEPCCQGPGGLLVCQTAPPAPHGLQKRVGRGKQLLNKMKSNARYTVCIFSEAVDCRPDKERQDWQVHCILCGERSSNPPDQVPGLGNYAWHCGQW